MNRKILSKVLATTLAVILTFTNFIMLGVYATKSYATTEELENQKMVSNNENVEFDAYFMNEEGKKIHTSKQEIEASTKMYLAVNVKKGYLKNAKIAMLGENNKPVNFTIKANDEIPATVEKIDLEKNEILLKQLNSGTQVVLEIPITSINSELFDLSNFSKINNITLTGTYVDNNGKTIEVTKTSKTRIEWGKEVKAILEQETKTFIPYELKDNNGTILQTTIKTGIENNSLPIKQTKIDVTVPQINGEKPEEVIVTASNTYGTNNQTEDKFSKENWNYNPETGIISIIVKNEANENKVAWNKNAKDEYVITYIFKEKLASVKLEQKADLEIEAYNNVITNIKQANTLQIEENEIKGNYVTTEISSQDALSKGYLYTKSEKETTYNEKVTLSILYAKLSDKIVVENIPDNFINEKGEISPSTISNINYAYYKTTSISKADFEKILGEEGYIKILGRDGEQLAIFTKDTQADENGNYIYTYNEETNQIKIETSKPITEGKIEINHVKSLKGKTDYSRNQIADFQKLQLKTITDVEYEGMKIENKEVAKDITLVAPITKVEASVSKSNLSTVVKNENVEIRVTLKTNDISCDLYKNPVVEIVLPSYIEELNIKDINLLFDNELNIKNYRTYKNASGNIVIEVILNGEQTTYSGDELTKGANIVINTDITLKKLTPTTGDVMKVYVTNENVTTYENVETTKQKNVATKGYAEIGLKAVAPVGIVTTNTIQNYNSNGETVTSISGEEKTGKLQTKTENKNATVKMNVINNYENKINNIAILGRIPFAGNKNTKTGEDLGSNLTTTLSSAITTSASGATVYYSINENATKDLTDSNNSWKTDITDFSNIKSYLVVFNNYEMNIGNNVEVSYNIGIPENLSQNLYTYGIYTVYFDNVKQNETTTEDVTATKVGLTTGQGPELEAKLIGEEYEIEEGNEAIYKVQVKNIGKIEATNVIVNGKVTQNGATRDLEEQKIERMAVGETKEVSFKVSAGIIMNEEQTQMEMQAIVKADNLENDIETEKVNIKTIPGYLNYELTLGSTEISKEMQEQEELQYVLTIRNVNGIVKEDVVVKDILPEGIKFKEATQGGEYDEKTRTITWKLGNIKEFDVKILVLNIVTDNLPNGEMEKEITNKMTIITKDKTLDTNSLTFNVKKPSLTIKQSTKTDSPIGVGDTIIYNVTIENNGTTVASDIQVVDAIPEGLKYDETQYSINGKTYSNKIGNKEAIIMIPALEANQKVELSIKMIADSLNGEKEKEVTNIVKVSADGISEIKSNEIKHKIVQKSSTTNDPSTENSQEGTLKISGLVWLDENKDGKRDENEKNIPGISVTLINAENGKIVTDITTGKNKEQQTNENGVYTFANLKPGKYMIVFQYDTSYYGVSIYQKEGVNDDVNSDVVLANAKINGETKKVAATNKISLGSGNLENIDMGLIVNPKFDLKIDKVISKIVEQTETKSTLHEYEDSKFAKLDIPEKTLKNTKIIVEYKIKVTNEGDVAGYAKKIIDYIPKDMEFSSELNSDWYQSTSGNIYSTGLANTVIMPGETKELVLLLTKKMSDEKLGIINNNAEIAESYNDLGIADIDSTPANNVQDEDDISHADAMISVKTGEVYVYITITLISIAILGVGIYFINKKVLRRI